MGLFGFGKKKKADPEEIVREFSKNFDEAVKNTNFSAVLREKKEQEAKGPVLAITEENLLKFLSENSGKKVRAATKLGSVYDYSDPLTDIFLQGDLEKRFGVTLKEEFEEGTTAAQVLRALQAAAK